MRPANGLPNIISKRDNLILAGLYLSKFDQAGLRELGFDSFVEAFNVIAFALGSKPASLKNYRDEFDPLFPNRRAGWHKRVRRDYCLKIFEQYDHLDFAAFTVLVESFFRTGAVGGHPENEAAPDVSKSSFAQRLITGLAAERYFEAMRPSLAEFHGYSVENTTSLGCGYDFRMRSDDPQVEFLAVEVKGLKDRHGSVSMTSKEYDVASAMGERFYLFVVRNFREIPTHDIFRDPISGLLPFRRIERVVVQVSWLTTV